MKKLLTSTSIYVMESKIPGAGRGVYAACDVKKGEVIETCPIIKVSKDEAAHLNESSLVTYFFYFGRNKEELLIALGFGSIYNHSYNPNADYKIQPTKNIIDFVAIKAIKKDTEITTNYNHGTPKDKNPLWFEVE